MSKRSKCSECSEHSWTLEDSEILSETRMLHGYIKRCRRINKVLLQRVVEKLGGENYLKHSCKIAGDCGEIVIYLQASEVISLLEAAKKI